MTDAERLAEILTRWENTGQVWMDAPGQNYHTDMPVLLCLLAARDETIAAKEREIEDCRRRGEQREEHLRAWVSKYQRCDTERDAAVEAIAELKASEARRKKGYDEWEAWLGEEEPSCLNEISGPDDKRRHWHLHETIITVKAYAAERDAAVATLAVMREALTRAHYWFFDYGNGHADKGAADKAKRNFDRAAYCGDALRTLPARAQALLRVVKVAREYRQAEQDSTPRIIRSKTLHDLGVALSDALTALNTTEPFYP